MSISGKAKDCQGDGHPHLEGWIGTENRQRYPKNVVWKEVRSCKRIKKDKMGYMQGQDWLAQCNPSKFINIQFDADVHGLE